MDETRSKLSPPRHIVATGMHRSGTSALARLLHSADLFMGDRLVAANEFNPRGHFEDLAMLRIHDRILAASGTSWRATDVVEPKVRRMVRSKLGKLINRREVDHQRWGFKDPRACLLLPLWKDLLPDLKILGIFRDPMSVRDSLLRREHFDDPDMPYKIWANYNSRLLDAAEAFGSDVILISTRGLFNGFPIIDYLNETWDLQLTPAPNSAAIEVDLLTSDTPSSTMKPELVPIWDALASRDVAASWTSPITPT